MAENSEQSPSVIGIKLLAARQEKKLSLRELASAADISASMLSQIETGKAFPSVRSLYKIAAALDVPLDYFFPAESEAQADQGLGEIIPAELTASQLREAMMSEGRSARVAGFVSEDSRKGLLMPVGGRPRIELQSGVTWARLTAQAEPGVEFMEISYQPGAKSGENLSSHEGREFGLLLDGELLVELAFESYTLKAGDSIIFDSNTPHRFSNVSDGVMRALWVVLSSE